MEALRSVRRHDLDWLRVGVFGIFIVWHVAVALTDWNAAIARYFTAGQVKRQGSPSTQ